MCSSPKYAMQPFEESEKLRDVLNLLLLPDYNIATTTYFDILLSHISDRITAQQDLPSDGDINILQKWLLTAMNTWNIGKRPCQVVLTFTVKLVGILGRNEVDFMNWYRDGTIAYICKVLRLSDDDLQPSIKMAYTTMLLEFVKHKAGRNWVIESGTWKDMVKFCHSNQTLYLTRESQKFVWQLLQYECENEEFCKEMIFTIAEPLIHTKISSQIHSSIEETYLDQNKLLLPTIDLLAAVLENTLFTDTNNKLPKLIESTTNLDSRIKGLVEACIGTTFFRYIMKVMYLVQFMMLKIKIRDSANVPNPEALREFGNYLYYVDSMLLSKNYVLEMVQAARYTLVYWKKICSLYDFELPIPFKVEHQCIVVMAVPLGVCMHKLNTTEDIVEVFVNKLFHISCELTQRMCYIMRDIMLKHDLPIERIAKSTIQIILDTVDIMDRDLAVIIFQSMIYVLKQYAFTTKEDHSSPDSVSSSLSDGCTAEKDNPRILKFKSILAGDPIVQRPVLLSALLDGLAALTRKFKLKWQECVETICILSISQEILNHPSITPKLSVQALTLCKLAIQNFMTPNLALLVDSESHMDEMGPVLFKRMHDPNWEVQDSVLEVIITIATISEDKYPAFQNLLLKNGFPQLIVDIARSDSESYVRASALSCIVIFVRIHKIWDNVLRHLDLPEMALNLLANESEAIVRRVVVMLVKELYEHRKWPKMTIDKMVKAMATAAVLDLHWEVKVNALEFWRQFIKSHLSDQGMLDGTFPSMTFSKEHKKIVALNEDEIKKRILKALNELAIYNCLGVLVATLEDDSDFQVCKASADIISKLKNLFVTYKINESSDASLSQSEKKIGATSSLLKRNSVNSWDATTSTAKPQLPMDIIDFIVDSDDMSLLASVYSHTMNMNCNPTSTEREQNDSISHVTTTDFIRWVLNLDIDAYIEEKNRWLKTYTNSFISVIDDIITAHQSNNVNAMDCY